MGGADHKRGQLTEEGFFVGVQWPMVLVAKAGSFDVISVSRKKVVVNEDIYAHTNNLLHHPPNSLPTTTSTPAMNGHPSHVQSI